MSSPPQTISSESVEDEHVMSHANIRIFGGSTARAKADADRRLKLNKLCTEQEELRSKESTIRQLYCPDIDPDTVDLVKVVEVKAKSSDPSSEHHQHLKVLLRLRKVDQEIATIKSHVPPHELHFSTQPESGIRGVVSKPAAVDGARFWAVIVGIDSYHTSPLSGACSDAKNIYDYLVGDLQVVPDHIQLLLSEGSLSIAEDKAYSSRPATRKNILSALLDGLRDNVNIQHGDNILFYFSGHGTSYPSTPQLESSTPIEALCPADRNALDPNGILIPDISDREIAIFLKELREAKGNSITVIFDCCHSGGATRAPLAGTKKTVEPTKVSVEDMLRAADQDPRRREWSKKALRADWDWDNSDCVLLAACEASEYAQEGPHADGGYNGYFTHTLLASLRAGHGKTYRDLCDAVKLYMPTFAGQPIQTPSILGARQDSTLWYTSAEEEAVSQVKVEEEVISQVKNDHQDWDIHVADILQWLPKWILPHNIFHFGSN
ncbi:hypothetical protein NM688_g7398 [Phlebia brevispora]|uniref:Uncharacterized protein n=1 Tax=Phlebia brevispora TaxID=194682 RepID=A0ACC1S5K9_9APHY|nr:hypothetical protein NM688_g7398 [Phlebia brevispora]